MFGTYPCQIHHRTAQYRMTLFHQSASTGRLHPTSLCAAQHHQTPRHTTLQTMTYSLEPSRCTSRLAKASFISRIQWRIGFDTMGSFGTTFPYPQRTYLPMFLDDITQMLPFSSFYAHIECLGTLPVGVFVMHVDGEKG